jgi:hypothetical protein
MIRYNKAFTEQVGGALNAQFQLDANKVPTRGEEDGTTFYFIRLNVIVPSGTDIDSVTYILDPSYWEPERESTERANNFAEDITSYGDFLVRVEVKKRSNRITQQALLSEMLEAGHPAPRSAAIDDALDYIRNN